MVKTPRTRHSRTEKEPVTIDLAADEVSRVAAEKDAAPREAPNKVADPTPQAEAPAPGTPFSEPVSEAPEPETPAPGQSAPPSSGSVGGPVGGVVAGLIGGVAALALAAGLQFYGLLPGAAPAPQAAIDDGPAIAALEGEIAAVRNEVAALAAAGDDGAALDRRIADIEERVAGLASGLDSLRGDVSAIEAAPEAGAAMVDLSPVEDRIATLEQASGELREQAAAAAEALAAVEEAVAGLRGDVAAGRDRQADLAPRCARSGGLDPDRPGRRAGRSAGDGDHHRRVLAEGGDRPRRAVHDRARHLCGARARRAAA
jgi:hypothetical protein